MATTSKVLSLDGLAPKVNTRADVESWLTNVDPTVIEEIHLGGHTFSLEACLALAEFLEKTTVLKASIGYILYHRFFSYHRVVC